MQNPRMVHGVALVVLLVSPIHAAVSAATTVNFDRDIAPLLANKCFACHGPDEDAREAGLRLDQPEEAAAELESGAVAIVPGRPEASELVRRITAEDEGERMPPIDAPKQLTAAEIETLRRWVAEGATYTRHWAYQPVRRAEPPLVRGPWAQAPIDRFILNRLQQENIAPSPEADRATLIRRLSFDLLGLPPRYEEVRAFSEDKDPAAYDKLVGRLLDSPHFGERMAIYWLDLVRYADSVGYHGDQEISVSPFRDYVINAFNDNMPFDRFTREQLGGDLMPQATLGQRVASGYNRLGMMSAEGGVQPKEYLAKYAAERVRNVSQVWMGATMGCCECHNHKFDPYSANDFYAMASFFADIKEQGIYGGAHASGEWGPRIAVPTPAQRAQLDQLELQNAALDETPPGNDEQQQQRAARRDELQQQKAELEKTFLTTHVTVAVQPREMRVLPRGNWMDKSGEIVEPAVPHFLAQLNQEGRANRRDLAAWLVASDNPLTARVFVNRLWMLYFGRGLVRSLDDFGKQGVAPSHPELLDWLAAEFIDSGWDIKHMVWLLVTSATYRQLSVADETDRRRDPYNELVARQGRYRLSAEVVRDNVLATSGLLVRRIGGRSVRPYQPPGYYAHLNFPKREYQQDTGDNLWRRSVYTHWQRQFLHPSLMAFDAPSREECTVQRPRSNTPLAALVLLNDPIYVEGSRAFAERVLREASRETAGRLNFIFQQALSRAPHASERTLLSRLLENHLSQYLRDRTAAAALIDIGERPTPKDLDAAELAAWTGVCRIILNTHEFITRS